MPKRPPKRPAWIVWSIDIRGHTSLRAMCSINWLANAFRKVIKNSEIVDGSSETTIKVWVERTQTDHLYGASGDVLPEAEMLELLAKTGYIEEEE